MITEMVSPKREARILLEVRGTVGASQRVEAIIDTGFSGFLTLPDELHATMATPKLGDLEVILADGSVRNVAYHEVTVLWDGKPRIIEAEALDALPFVGMAMLDGHELRAVIRAGGVVTIQALPPAAVP